MPAKQAKVQVETVHHEDGGFTHTLHFTNGQTRIWSVEPDHDLYHRYASTGAKSKALATINSADDADAAVQKFDALVDASDEGKWSLVGEGGPKYTPFVRALAQLKGIDPAEADKLVKGMSKSTQAKLRATERMSVLIAKFKGEQDGDAALDALLGKKTDPDEVEDAA